MTWPIRTCNVTSSYGQRVPFTWVTWPILMHDVSRVCVGVRVCVCVRVCKYLFTKLVVVHNKFAADFYNTHIWWHCETAYTRMSKETQHMKKGNRQHVCQKKHITIQTINLSKELYRMKTDNKYMSREKCNMKTDLCKRPTVSRACTQVFKIRGYIWKSRVTDESAVEYTTCLIHVGRGSFIWDVLFIWDAGIQNACIHMNQSCDGWIGWYVSHVFYSYGTSYSHGTQLFKIHVHIHVCRHILYMYTTF